MRKLNHAFVSAIADGSDATVVRPSNWNADIQTTIPDTAVAEEVNRVVLPSTDRMTLATTGRVRIVGSDLPFLGAYKLGSVVLYDDSYMLQYKRATLAATARATLAGTSEIFLFDLAPVGRLVLAGSGGI